MMEPNRYPSLDRPTTYHIQVPGDLGRDWLDWAAGMTISIEYEDDSEGNRTPVTTLTGSLDQAALQGLLRRLYALGLPLISVHCGED